MEIHTNASTVGVDAILIQVTNDMGQVVPNAYARKASSAAQKNYGAAELELCAMIFAVKTFFITSPSIKTSKL